MTPEERAMKWAIEERHAAKCWAVEVVPSLAAMIRTAVVEERERLGRAVNSLCSCGGKGPDDPGVCDVCMVWHRVTR